MNESRNSESDVPASKPDHEFQPPRKLPGWIPRWMGEYERAAFILAIGIVLAAGIIAVGILVAVENIN